MTSSTERRPSRLGPRCSTCTPARRSRCRAPSRRSRDFATPCPIAPRHPRNRSIPRLLELLRQVALRNPGARLELVSGYRSPKLNEMLRKKGHRVASHSQHSLGHAVDFRIIGKTPAEMKKEILKVGWEGGIGQYDGPSDLLSMPTWGPSASGSSPSAEHLAHLSCWHVRCSLYRIPDRAGSGGRSIT